LHAKNILIQEGSVEVKSNKEGSTRLSITGHEYGFERDFYVIHLGEDLPTNEEMVVTIG